MEQRTCGAGGISRILTIRSSRISCKLPIRGPVGASVIYSAVDITAQTVH